MSVSLTDQFIQERKYLLAVTPKTVIWYGCGFKAFEGALESKETVNRRIVQLSERGVKPITINSYLRCINAYFTWLHKEHDKDLIRIPRLKEDQNILATFSVQQIHRLIHWKPIKRNETRAPRGSPKTGQSGSPENRPVVAHHPGH